MTATVATKDKTKTASEIAEKLLADESFTNKLDKAISVLMDAIATASRKNVIYDTIDAITTYMKINNY